MRHPTDAEAVVLREGGDAGDQLAGLDRLLGLGTRARVHRSTSSSSLAETAAGVKPCAAG